MQNINVVFICDDNYVMPTIVAITSLIDTTKFEKKRLNIQILTFNLSSHNVQLLLGLNKNEHISVEIYDQTSNINYRNKVEVISQKSHVTPTALLKFEIPNILPKTVEKTLYLDSDVIVKRDITSLYEYDISKDMLAACYDYWKCQMLFFEYSDSIGIPDFYFNSGVLLINVKKWRDDNISEILWQKKIDMLKNPENKSFLMDQDVLNNILAKKCVKLPFKYNCNPRFISNYHLDVFNEVYGTKYQSAEEIYDDAVVIHYVGKEDKPWTYIDGKCRNIWDKYYVQAGYEIQNLNRKRNIPNIRNIIEKIKKRMKDKGLINAIKYVLDNIIGR